MITEISEVEFRSPQSDDFDWMIEAHRKIYAKEYGWNEKFAGVVSDIVRKFSFNHNSNFEQGWIAEKKGERLGCVLLVKESNDVAKLRVLLVDPKGRGLGIGSQLVQNCISFAKEVGYKKIILWTHPELHSARKIYEANGFSLIKEESDNVLGKEQIFQYWSKDL